MAPRKLPRFWKLSQNLFSCVGAVTHYRHVFSAKEERIKKRKSLYTETQSGLTSAFLSAPSKEQSKLSSSSDKGGQKKCMRGAGTTCDPKVRG